MRVSELAKLAGVSVRTVRHYHQIGLLPVPPIKRGARRYRPGDLVLLLRVRAFADAGVPLADIPPLLAPSPENITEALDSTLEKIDASIARLNRQRELLLSLKRGDGQDAASQKVEKMHADFEQGMAELSKSDSLSRIIAQNREVTSALMQLGLVDEDFLNSVGNAKAIPNDEAARFAADLEALSGPHWTHRQARAIAQRMVRAKMQIVPVNSYPLLREKIREMHRSAAPVWNTGFDAPGIRALIEEAFVVLTQILEEENGNEGENSGG
ncbi:MerR family transcriptional regulator [Dermabacteraceae bacterium P7006]